MERFVQAIVIGGVALVVGLWLIALFAPRRPGWILGTGLVLAGAGGLGWGIWSELEY